MIVEARYHLPKHVVEELRGRPVRWGFGGLSEAVYYRTYSRQMEGGGQEGWADTVARVVEGVLSIRKDWLVNVVGRRWDAARMDALAEELAGAVFDMKLLPPGRGLWVMGTDYVYDRGSHALNNCGAVEVTDSLADAAHWLMDSLMCGVGVGFTTHTAALRFAMPSASDPEVFRVPDSREGWAESVRLLVRTYERGGRPVEFDYSAIRPAGAPLRGFGGISAGRAPLVELHERLRSHLWRAASGKASSTRTIADVMNEIGRCVVAGNIRRSAELAVGSPHDEEFLNLKNYDLYPERLEIGGLSNNSVALRESADFDALGALADRVRDNGEPGIVNMLNIRKYGRTGDRMPDRAVAVNPCGEIPLESMELCNLVEVFPTHCPEDLPRIFELATFYASTVALLRSHSAATNAVTSRNRRIGVSVSGVADWLDATSVSTVFGALNRGYDAVRAENRRLAAEAGVAESVRVTTVKPSGTVSLLAGVSAGMHFPLDAYVVRRVRMGDQSQVAELLRESGVPWEPDVATPDTAVFSFPLSYGAGRTRSVKRVPLYEQAAIVAMLQRCWADNAVSNTLTFQPDEAKHVGNVLSLFAPLVKSMSLMPDREGVYAQMPVEPSSREDFRARTEALRPVRWGALRGHDGAESEELYCTTDACEVAPAPA